MTTFNLKNYDDTPTKPNETQVAADTADTETTGPVASTNVEGNISNDAASTETDINKIEITITGSLSEAVAKSLYKVFPNIQTISQEEHGSVIHLQLPSINSKQINIVAISKEDIVTNPVESLRLANTKDSVAFISNNQMPVNTKEEEWFYTNLSNEHYFHLSLLKNLFNV